MLFLISSTALAQFTADMVTTEGDVSKTSKFYVENPFYRMDMEEGGQKMFVVVNNETKLVGEETVNGYKCEKYQVMIDGSPVSTYWQSPEIEYPIKVISGEKQNMIMELKNIEKGDVDDAMFKVPAGFTKMEMPMPGMK